MITKIQVLNSNDLEEMYELISIFEDVFEMKNFVRPNKIHLQNLILKDTFIAAVAKVDNRIVAGLSVYVLDQYYSTKPLA